MSADNLTLQWALHYATHGYRVIPIKPNQKRPPIAQWQDIASTNTGTITQWFTGIYADHGIGIVTGELDSGERFIVLDIDNKDGDQLGSETLQQLENKHGKLPNTVKAETGGGGMHILLKLAPHHPMPSNGAGRYLGQNIDIRGHNAQIVVAPTVHPNGRKYQWMENHAIGEIELAQAPDWLIELLTPPEYPTAVQNATETKRDTTENTEDTRAGTRFNRATTWEQLLTADGWQPHHQDHTGTYHWTRPAKAIHDGASATVNHKGNDLLTVFTTAIHNLPTGTYDRFGYWVATRYQGDFTAAARELNQTDKQNQQLEIQNWINRIQTATEHTPLQIDDNNNHTPELNSWFIQWNQFWQDDTTDNEWLVEPVLAKARGHALYAGAKSGKSLMLLEIAAALATGKPVLNQAAQPPIHVLYVDYEMSMQDIKDRLVAFGYGEQDDLTHLHYALLPSIGGLDTPEGAKTIVDAVHHHNIELVVIDTTARAVEGAENDADTLRAFYRWTGLALKSKKCTYIRADHAGKDSSKGQRGTSAKNDDVDLVWRFTKRGADNILLEATHRRMSWVPEKVEIELRDTEQGLRHFTIDNKPSMQAQNLVIRLTSIGVNADQPLNQVRKILKEHDIKCAQDTLRQAMKILKTNSLTAAAVSSYDTSRTSDGSSVSSSVSPVSPRLAPVPTGVSHSVSPRLDIASHETQTTLYKERLASDQPNDDDLGLF